MNGNSHRLIPQEFSYLRSVTYKSKMKNTIVLCLYFVILISCTPTVKQETKSSTIKLFNGTDLSDWHVDVPDMDRKDTVWRDPFIVRDSMLISLGTPEGHLITDSVYQNYRLEVQYRFVGESGNCGVLVHASTPRALYKMFPKSLEVQMMHENAGDF